MRFNDLLVEGHKRILSEATVGRDLQHIEDYLIVDGAEGGLASLIDLKSLADNAGESSVKWDGTMAIYWGYSNQGQFYLIPNAQWAKKAGTSKRRPSIRNTKYRTQTSRPNRRTTCTSAQSTKRHVHGAMGYF